LGWGDTVKTGADIVSCLSLLNLGKNIGMFPKMNLSTGRFEQKRKIVHEEQFLRVSKTGNYDKHQAKDLYSGINIHAWVKAELRPLEKKVSSIPVLKLKALGNLLCALVSKKPVNTALKDLTYLSNVIEVYDILRKKALSKDPDIPSVPITLDLIKNIKNTNLRPIKKHTDIKLGKIIKYGGKKFKLIKFLGDGKYGAVFLVKDLHNKKKGGLSVIKIIARRPKHITQKVKRQLTRTELDKQTVDEINIQKMFHHKHVLGLIDFRKNENFFFLRMPYAKGKDLWDRVHPKKNEPKLTDVQKLDIIEQLILVIQYIHKNKVRHLDLKLENCIIIERNNRCFLIICDFGCSVLLSDDKTKTIRGPILGIGKLIGSPISLAPEGYGQFGITLNNLAKIDPYALGVLLLELITEYNGTDFDFEIKSPEDQQKAHMVVARKLIGKNHRFYKLVIALLKLKPKKRPKISELGKYFKYR